MALLALNVAGTALRAGIGSGVSRLIAGWFADDLTGDRLEALELQTSTEGAAIPIVYGRMRLTGQVIWASRFTEHEETETAGGKGGPSVTRYRYTVSLAVGLCEGPVARVGRVWANGAELDLSRVTMRVHAGSEDQLPDGLIEAIEPAGEAPAYRGLAYAVFEDLPLEDYGNLIPNLAFEVIAAGPEEEDGLEQRVEGVCLIPASGEFAYAGTPVMRKTGEGAEAAENVHTRRAATDMEAALDDLAASLPQVKSVALVTAWFGSDLRCGDCEIRPGVETRLKDTRPLIWRSAGQSRATAWLVSEIDGSPAYGGTPSDETVIAAIRALKSRGWQVTLYPFILMDVPAGNGLSDPYGGAEQGAYPWRGRITCHPAPGQAGSSDKTVTAGEQVAAFFGSVTASDFAVSGEQVDYSGPAEWRFSRFILHHGALAKAAGGVEAFLIGSEMRALTTVRDGAVSYPSVARLKALAGEARALLGPDVKLSYAADWSEYWGHQPSDGSNDRLFHLDPLWSDSEIDFVGIDWYAPLADWRDGTVHADAQAGWKSIHDPAYLAANVEGGEGYDWYYASEEDRAAQRRTPIADSAHGEDFIFRYKDVRGWWASPHHDRPGGVRSASPTGWVPEMKPIRFVELGCPAVDKGANQPNVFIDPKSSESVAPYFSDRRRDDLMQRRFIEALIGYWRDNNPASSVYGGPMLDLAHSQVWTWDARPFPEFPALDTVWSDGGNWRLGHWLTGRAGQSSLARIVAGIAERCGLDTLDVTALDGLVAGFVIDRAERGRDVLSRLGAVFGFDLVDRADGPAALMRGGQARASLLSDALVRAQDEPVVALSRLSPSERPRELRLAFLRDDGDYRPASAYARGLDGTVEGLAELSLKILSDDRLAAGWAGDALTGLLAAGEGARLSLPPSAGALEPGDIVALQEGPQGRVWRVSSLDGLAVREADLETAPARGPSRTGPDPQGAGEPVSPLSRPVLRSLDLPLAASEADPRGGLWVTAHADPWPGEIVLFAGPDAASLTERARLTRRAVMGELTASFGAGFEGRWDRAGRISLRLYRGALSSAERLALLAGANRLAIEMEQGWEVVQFRDATLETDGSWTLSTLLRGLGGSPASGAPAGACAVLLNGAGVVLPVFGHERGETLIVRAVPAGRALDDLSAAEIEAVHEGVDQRPLNPVHLGQRQAASGREFSWIRRTRRGGDAWGPGSVPLGEAYEAYQVRLLDGGGTVLHEETVAAPVFTLDPALEADLYPGGVSGARFEVAQISEILGPGARASLIL